jgi:Protein of unknown function (DUF3320)
VEATEVEIPQHEPNNGAGDGSTNSPEETDLETSAKPSNVNVYEECALTVPVRRDLLDLTVGEISRLAMIVVEAEGPIHSEEVAKRIREAFGLQKTGNRILTHVRKGLSVLLGNRNLSRDGEFWIVQGRDIQSIRSRRNASLSLRRAAMIAPNEYRLAIMTIIAEAVAISREDLIVETARAFGFDRTGPDLKEEIDRQTAALVKRGQLANDGSVLRPTSSVAGAGTPVR